MRESIALIFVRAIHQLSSTRRLDETAGSPRGVRPDAQRGARWRVGSLGPRRPRVIVDWHCPHHQASWDTGNLERGRLAGVATRCRLGSVPRDAYDPQDMVFGDTRPVLQTLRSAGYTLGLVSNRSEDLLPLAEKYGIADLFHFTLSAGQAGCFKPEPGIFYKSLALAGVTAKDAVYIGDNFFADVIGALNVGIDAILIDPRDIFAKYYARRVKQLRDVLAELGVVESAPVGAE